MNVPARKNGLLKVADHVVTRLLARLAMIVCAGVGAPAAMWIIQNTYASLDKLSNTQADLTRIIELLSQKVEFNNHARTADGNSIRIDLARISAELAEFSRGRYTPDAAQRDLRLRDQRLDQHERRIETLERR